MDDELSIDDLDHVTGGKAAGGGGSTSHAGTGTGTGGGDGLGWLRGLIRNVVGPLGGVAPTIQHEDVHAS